MGQVYVCGDSLSGFCLFGWLVCTWFLSIESVSHNFVCLLVRFRLYMFVVVVVVFGSVVSLSLFAPSVIA